MAEVITNTLDPYPDRVQDINKAHVMALAGNELRIKAAFARKMHAQINENKNSIWDEKDDSYFRYAQQYDRDAERLEDWSGVLYQYPVNQTYKDWHLSPLTKPEDGLMEFTPNDMVALENGARYWINNLKRGIADDPDRFDAKKQTYARRSTRWNILGKIRELDKVRPGLENQVDEMLRVDSTTIGDLVAFYSDAWHRIVKSRRRTVEKLEAILVDVKTGRASSWEPPAETDQKSQTAPD